MGLDHILFVFALAAGYLISDWRKILVLVTAFTIGHSLTLALATLKIIAVRTDVVEFFIIVTIIIAAVSNLFQKQSSPSRISINYGYALFFGLIHGLGFSNTLRALLSASQDIVIPLLAFNLGLELGQIIIVALFLAAGFISVNLLGVSRYTWKTVLSSAIAGMALMLLRERIFW